MRIGLVTPGFSASDEDWCIPVLQNIARGLAEQHDVTVYSIAYPPESRRYRVKGVETSACGDSQQGRVAAARRIRRTVAAIRRDHRERPFDLLHGFWPDSGGVVCRLAVRGRNIPWVVSAMGGELIDEASIDYGKRKKRAGRLARFGCGGAADLNVGSLYHRDRIRAEVPGFDPSVVRLGVDTDMFDVAGSTAELDGAIPILCVGSLVPVKGHDTVLRAIARATRSVDVHLHVVGEGPLKEALHESAVSYGIDRQVTFHGNVPHDDLPAYYRGAAFCVLGSYFENIAMVIPEAAACGRLTVGSAVGVLPELCPADPACTPGDAEALSAAIVEVARDDAFRSERAAEARDETRKHFAIEKTVRDLSRLYQEIAG